MAAVDWPVLGIQREAGQPRGMDWRAARAHPGSVPFILSKFVATWNGFPPRGLVSRRIALRHWRTTDVPWLALPYTAAHLGFEAQKAAFRLLGLGGCLTKTTTDEISAEAIVPRADTAPASVAVAPKTRHAAKKIYKKSAPVRKRGKRAKRG